MSKQTFTTGQVLTSAEMTQLQANDYNQTVSAKVASYTLVASDAGTRITMANVAATTITVNTALFTAGDTLTITNISSGVCTITAGTATVSTAGSLALNQYDSGTLYFTSTGVSIWNGANPGDITGVTAGTGISGGGTSGTVTVTNSMATAITTNGDMLYGTGSGTFSRLGIGSTGQVLNVASGIPAWATPASGAMTFITRSTFSAVATVTIDSIFTSTYDTYCIVFERILQSSSANMRAQFRYGSTTQATSYYSNVVCFAASQTQQNDSNTAYATLMHNMSASQESAALMWVNGVGQTSERGVYHGTGIAGGLGPGCPYIFAAWQNTAQTYTGMIFSSSAGNLTGEISVYGLVKA